MAGKKEKAKKRPSSRLARPKILGGLKRRAPSRSTVPEEQLSGSPAIPVVGIGYSAGGLEAASLILSRLETDSGMAFVLVPHLKVDQPSRLAEIFSRECRLPVKEIKNGERVKADTVYVLPPGFDVAIAGDCLHLNPRGQSDAFHLGIDFFFSSLSQFRKSRAVGVILSGTGSDGTIGLKAIKGEGGVTIVQDPKSAKFDGMPRSALASGVVDLVLGPADIAKELTRIAKHPYTRAELPAEQALELEGKACAAGDAYLSQIISALRFHTQVDFSHYKVSTIRRRIERQMMLRKISSIDKYAEYLNKNAEEVRALYEDIFIHVTDFFRDTEVFEAVEKLVFPKLVEGRAADQPIRIWVPGCATGEEVYSLAIALQQFLEKHGSRLRFQIFGTDISEPAIQRARRGVFAEYQMRNVSAEQLEQFFERVTDGYKIKKAFRDLCIFSRHDVTSNPPIPKVDLISCRNVLIYFSGELQKRVFPVFHYALNPTGFLVLGRAESPGTESHLFKPIDKVNKIYTKIQAAHVMQSQFKAASFGADPAARSTIAFSSAADSSRNADQIILYRYSPPSVVVNDGWDILQFRGRTVPYIEPAPGVASYNLLKMANAEIAPSLRACLQAARKQGVPVRKENIGFSFEGRKRKVSIDVSPLNPAAANRDRQYLIIFEEATGKSAKPKPAPAHPPKLGKGGKQDQVAVLSQYVVQLQQELDTAREYQQSLGEEYETAQEELTSTNEELRSTNEELQSTNEELQSANEELGTSKEELQAANEELLSTNDELQKRNLDLEHALKALEQSERRFRLMIESVRDYAIFMLDPTGHIASWNLGAERLKGYRAEEIIGSHFSRFYTEEDKQRHHPEHELELAKKQGVYEEEGWRIRKDGSRFWALVVITAIRDKDHTLIGFAKVTRDLTERKNTEEALKRSRDELEQKVADRTAELASTNESLARAVAARDEFLSLASHELKTPLTTLLMQAQIRVRQLQKSGAESFTAEKLQKMFDTDSRMIGRLGRLIDDMLDISRIGSKKLELKTEKVNLCSLVRDVIERFSPQFTAAGCTVTVDLCEEAIGRFDRFRLEQVLGNLFTNAVKYAPGKPVHISLSREGKRALLKVKDEGIGISKKDQPRIFEQFERATGNASGLGLGLYIAQHIVRNHGGEIGVESEVGEGATFFIELPLV